MPSIILDQGGRPFEREDIQAKGGVARTFPEKAHWQQSVATGIDPSRLADILRRNDVGDNVDMLTLAGEMDERDPNWFAQVQTRINAIAMVPMRVEPRKKGDKTAQKMADAFNETVLGADNWVFFIKDLMDAISKGYSVVQPIWDTTTRPWTFSAFEWIDPRHFHFDRKTKKKLRLRIDDDPEGAPLPAGMFLTHFPRIRSCNPARGGLARVGAVNWFFKTTEVVDWLAFAEVYGMPIRIGKYNAATATDDELATLHQALVNLGHDASAMIPDGMKLEIVDARRPTSGENLYKGIVGYFDEQTNRIILGQVLASDARATGLGTAIADLHAAVRQDIRESDAAAIRATVHYLLKLWSTLNYGPLAGNALKLKIDVEPPADLQKFTTAVLPWYVQGGLKVPKQWLYDKLQIPVPEDGEETISAPLAPGTPGAGPVAGVKSVKPGKGPAKEE